MIAPVTEDLYGDLLTVTTSPHIKHNATTTKIMAQVLIALTPAFIWGIIAFGWNAFLMPLFAVATSVLSEFLMQKLLKKPVTVGDLSAVVTGLLLGFNLPANNAYFLPIAGAAFAIAVTKQLFGGIGKNFVNPALAARVFLLLSWPEQMTAFPQHRWATDLTASATPAGFATRGMALENANLLDLFLGKCSGSIGEISALLLLVGGIYLIVRRVITWHIPVAYLGTVALLTLIFPYPDTLGFFDLSRMTFELCSGGLMLGAIFMATDYVTSPITWRGRLIFGVGCGLLTVFFRYFNQSYPEGVSFSILVMNCLVWYIDKITRPRVFGGARHGQ
ncbi:MAG: RnfABCDGE type electron transport complex subunit D [Ruminococcaceae bacterium]|nr:RnfABCDGE type electron transport complex subunit D [Oscillospiraceae bacterium]